MAIYDDVMMTMMLCNLRRGEDGKERLEDGTTSLLKDNFQPIDKITRGAIGLKIMGNV